MKMCFAETQRICCQLKECTPTHTYIGTLDMYGMLWLPFIKYFNNSYTFCYIILLKGHIPQREYVDSSYVTF